MIFSSNNSLIIPSISASEAVKVFDSLAWNTMFLMAFTFVGEPLRPTSSAFVLHYQLSVLRTTGSSTTVNSENYGQRSLNSLHTTVDDTLHGNLLNSINFLNVFNFLNISYLVEAQLLSYLRTYLSGITIDGLTTTNHDVYVAYLLDGGSQCVRSCEGIGTSEETVSEQPTGICTTIKSLTDNLTCTWRTHREDSYC